MSFFECALHTAAFYHVSVEAGADGPALLRKAGLAPSQLENPFSRIDSQQHEALLKEAVNMTGEPALGLKAGLWLKWPDFDVFGATVITSPAVIDAMRIGYGFMRMFSNVVLMEPSVEDGVGRIQIIPQHPESDEMLMVVDFHLGLFKTATATVPGPFKAKKLRVCKPKPANHTDYEQLYACPVEFSAPVNEVLFDGAWLEREMKMSDPGLHAIVEQQAHLTAAPFDDNPNLVERVRSLLSKHPENLPFPNLEILAEALCLKPRTLQAGLRAEGATFQELLDNVRLQRALQYLSQTRRSLEEIAQLLNFADASSFYRAFRRWTGGTPRNLQEEEA